MNMKSTTKKHLKKAVEELKNKLFEAEETIEAIKFNKIDALVVNTEDGEQIYTLQGAERPYRIILEQMNEGALTLSDDNIILFSNKKVAEILNIPLESVIGSSLYRWISLPDMDNFKKFINGNNQNVKQEFILLRDDNTILPVYFSLNIIKLNDFEHIKCLVITDLTEQKRNEEIVAAEKLARSILEQATEAIIVCDKYMKIIRASKAAENLAGKHILNKPFDSIFNFTIENVPINLEKIITSLPQQIDLIYNREDGQNFNIIFNAGALKDANDNILGYVITLTNITKHMAAEEKLTASLEEKTILLKEIHHRVKNNLQIISSLLRLQSQFIKDEIFLNIFDECQHRIKSMSLIHQKLYESKSLSSINAAEYLHDLVTYLSSTYNFNSNRLNLFLDSREACFNIETAIPIGLIMNELITNCFKHAFKDNKEGELTLSLFTDQQGNYCIILKDDGIGFPENLDMRKTDTLGLQLVMNLIDQINGTIELNRKNGTEFIINFPPSGE